MSATVQVFVIGWAAGATGLAIGAVVTMLDMREMLRRERARANRLYDIAFGYDNDTRSAA